MDDVDWECNEEECIEEDDYKEHGVDNNSRVG